MKSGKSAPARAPVSAPDLESAYQRARASIAFTAQDIRDIREAWLRITHRPFVQVQPWLCVAPHASKTSPASRPLIVLSDARRLGLVREPYTYDRNGIVYLADLADLAPGQKLHGRPVLASRRMAKHQSRLLLRSERVEPKWFLDITAEEIQAEGCPPVYMGDTRGDVGMVDDALDSQHGGFARMCAVRPEHSHAGVGALVHGVYD